MTQPVCTEHACRPTRAFFSAVIDEGINHHLSHQLQGQDSCEPQAVYADMNVDTGQAQQPTVAASPFTTAIYAGPLGNFTAHPFYQSLGNVSIAVRRPIRSGSAAAQRHRRLVHAGNT